MRDKLRQRGSIERSKTRDAVQGARPIIDAPIGDGTVEPPKESWSRADEIRKRVEKKSRVSGKNKSGANNSSQPTFSQEEIEEASQSRSGIFPGERAPGNSFGNKPSEGSGTNLSDMLSGRISQNASKNKTPKRKTPLSKNSGTSLSEILGGKSTGIENSNFQEKGFVDASDAIDESDNQGNSQNSTDNSSANNSGGDSGDYLPKDDDSYSTNNNDNSSGLFGDLLDQAQDAVGDAVEGASDTVNEIVEDISEAAGTEDGQVLNDLLDAAEDAVGNVNDVAGDAKNAIPDRLDAETVIDHGKRIGKSAVNQAQRNIENMLDPIKDYTTNAIDQSGIETPDRLDAEAVIDVGKQVGEIGAEMIQDKIDNVKSKVEGIADQTGDMLGEAARQTGQAFSDNVDKASENFSNSAQQAQRELRKAIRKGRAMAIDARVTGENFIDAAYGNDGNFDPSDGIDDYIEATINGQIGGLRNSQANIEHQLKQAGVPEEIIPDLASAPITTIEAFVRVETARRRGQELSDQSLADTINARKDALKRKQQREEQRIRDQREQQMQNNEAAQVVDDGTGTTEVQDVQGGNDSQSSGRGNNVETEEDRMNRRGGGRGNHVETENDRAGQSQSSGRGNHVETEDDRMNRNRGKNVLTEEQRSKELRSPGSTPLSNQLRDIADSNNARRRESNRRSQDPTGRNENQRIPTGSNLDMHLDTRRNQQHESGASADRTEDASENARNREESDDRSQEAEMGESDNDERRNEDTQSESRNENAGGYDLNIGNRSGELEQGGGGFSGSGSGGFIEEMDTGESFDESTDQELPEETKPRIRTDLEIVDIRFLDLGGTEQVVDEETGKRENVERGPRFRISVKNHNRKFAAEDVGIELIAAVDLSSQEPLQTVATGIIESIRADDVSHIDMTLAPNALELTKREDGNPIAFSQLAVIADPLEEFTDVNPENNVLVKDVDDVEHADLKLITVSTDGLVPNSQITITGEGFRFDPGVVALVMNKKAYPMTVTSWSPTAIQVKVPNFKLDNPVHANLVIVRPDKINTDPKAVKIVPPRVKN